MLNTEKCTEPDPAIDHIAIALVNVTNRETKKNSLWQPVSFYHMSVENNEREKKTFDNSNPLISPRMLLPNLLHLLMVNFIL